MTNKDTLRKALHELLDHYVKLANSGDCGKWDPEKEGAVIQARAALALFSKPIPGVES